MGRQSVTRKSDPALEALQQTLSPTLLECGFMASESILVLHRPWHLSEGWSLFLPSRLHSVSETQGWHFLTSSPGTRESEVTQSFLTLCDPMDCSLPGSSIHGVFQAGMGCHFLLQGIFLTQGSSPSLLHCRQMLYRLSHQGSPKSLSHVWLFGSPFKDLDQFNSNVSSLHLCGLLPALDGASTCQEPNGYLISGPLTAPLWELPWGKEESIALIEKKHRTQRAYTDEHTATQLVSGDVRGGARLSLTSQSECSSAILPSAGGFGGSSGMDLTLLPGLIWINHPLKCPLVSLESFYFLDPGARRHRCEMESPGHGTLVPPF